MSSRPSPAGLVLAALASIAASFGAGAEARPSHRVGECVVTRITAIAGRITPRPDPDTGYGMEFANDGGLVSYSLPPAVRHSRVGDRVRLCTLSAPRNCPPGDDRGYRYRATNLRTGQSWVDYDSQHMCGGA